MGIPPVRSSLGNIVMYTVPSVRGFSFFLVPSLSAVSGPKANGSILQQQSAKKAYLHERHDRPIQWHKIQNLFLPKE